MKSLKSVRVLAPFAAVCALGLALPVSGAESCRFKELDDFRVAREFTAAKPIRTFVATIQALQELCR